MADTKRKNAASTDGGSFQTNQASEALANNDEPDFVTTVATVGVIGVGVALIEASLIPGMVIGLAAMLAPKYVPKLGEGLRPLARSTVRGAVKLAHKTRDVIAEASESVQDIVAEAKLEDGGDTAASAHGGQSTGAA
ncbi:MAG TPA: DUF5132 domain-containing protein [Blastocatellia bacterium]